MLLLEQVGLYVYFLRQEFLRWMWNILALLNEVELILVLLPEGIIAEDGVPETETNVRRLLHSPSTTATTL